MRFLAKMFTLDQSWQKVFSSVRLLGLVIKIQVTSKRVSKNFWP